MADQPEYKQAGMRPGLRWLLIASLAVNFIIAGLAIGATLGSKKSYDRPPRDADLLSSYSRALEGPDRRQIAKNIRDHYHRNDDRPRPLRGMSNDIVNALKATPFDRAIVEDLIEGQAQIASERRAHAQKVWLDLITDMTDTERSTYADRIAEEVSKRKSHWRRPSYRSD